MQLKSAGNRSVMREVWASFPPWETRGGDESGRVAVGERQVRMARGETSSEKRVLIEE